MKFDENFARSMVLKKHSPPLPVIAYGVTKAKYNYFFLLNFFRPVIGPWALREAELANQSASYIGNILSHIIKLHSTCELNSLFGFWTLTSAPFKRLLDPGGKCKYISDMHGPISAARRQPQTKMLLMSCFMQKNQI